MNYQRINGLEVVMRMIIGDGDATRTDRLNLMNTAYTVVGIFSGTHSTNGHQSCNVYATDFVPDINPTEEILTE